ncbi:carboxypeptidase M32 [Leptotrichia sp. OH3620_COT-345]|uniref:carboxypeptidase M32 n=1 Tax=Leptotrichia sp. OH3620_COT-345 TaxID=2491048 RepID=UPI001F2EBE60|nr:carboxypeptidase M32 [Leptotrichia sp. OH3620_COT-345]
MENEKMKKVKEVLENNAALKHAITIMHWDLETEAPLLAVDKISKTLGYLIGESYSMVINDEFKNLVYSINTDKLKELDRKIIEELKKEYFEKLEKIPKEEYKKYSELKIISSKKWEEAKIKNDYSIFKSYLGEIIKFNKKIIKYRGYKGHPYNTLLEDYEPGITVKEADEFFGKIKNELSPLIKKIIQKNISDNENEAKEKFKKMIFDIEKQKELSKHALDIINFRFDKGVLKESEHPFTTNVDNKDVRVTTHYYKDNLLSSLYSTIHEGGHGLYEQNVDDVISDTILGTGTSMGIHESQSRIYENMFGRSEEFLSFIYPKLDIMFKLGENGINFNIFYKIANEVQASFIRTEADELTYPIHVLIRYELEKEIFDNLDNETDVDELAKKWQDKYEEYLGIRPETYTEGILQDVHWSDGLFGYFPSYALGSAYAAQIYNAISKKIDINGKMKKGDFTEINNELKEGIHKYGKTRTPEELLVNMTGEPFNPKYYIDYLKEKFSLIYGLK